MSYFSALKLSLLSLVLTACSPDTLSIFKHEPSQVFFETQDTTAQEVAPFLDGGLLLTLGVANLDDIEVYLFAYKLAPELPNLHVETAVLYAGDQQFMARDIQKSCSYSAEATPYPECEIQLFKIMNKSVLTRSEALKIVLNYTLDDTPGLMIYTLTETKILSPQH